MKRHHIRYDLDSQEHIKRLQDKSGYAERHNEFAENEKCPERLLRKPKQAKGYDQYHNEKGKHVQKERNRSDPHEESRYERAGHDSDRADQNPFGKILMIFPGDHGEGDRNAEANGRTELRSDDDARKKADSGRFRDPRRNREAAHVDRENHCGEDRRVNRQYR